MKCKVDNSDFSPNDNTSAAAAGVTDSERYLAGLCRRAFLRLWSYPNLYRDQRSHQSGEGKELCDLLVIFGSDVIIFSDKECAVRSGKTPEIAWRRWYQKAVIESVRQVAGAERWLLSHPDRVFLDRACQVPLPIELPTSPTIHRIVTCRGIAEASRQQWHGGSGSLCVTSKPLSACLEQPFVLGSFDDDGRMVHVLDEVALDCVLATLDTASDFCAYLRRKEALFRSTSGVWAAGEEELLGYYLKRFDSKSGAHDFVRDKGVDVMVFEEGMWKDWLTSLAREAWTKANEISYSWDNLIEKFSHHILANTQHFRTEATVKDHEFNIRWMARENRFRRRVLAGALVDCMNRTPLGTRRSRAIPPHGPGDPLWVFLVLPQPEFAEYEEYRQVRSNLLQAHLYAAKHIYPDARDIAGIAVDPRPGHISEDAMYMKAHEWGPDQAEEARHCHEDLGIFKHANLYSSKVREYPIEVSLQRNSRVPHGKKRKSGRKAQRHARRRNRDR